ncbi:hypothetical protein KAI87_14055, partial [Myxococcota bacterium]|nr:hypothetical protein [Myxococcota bacterium]
MLYSSTSFRSFSESSRFGRLGLAFLLGSLLISLGACSGDGDPPTDFTLEILVPEVAEDSGSTPSVARVTLNRKVVEGCVDIWVNSDDNSRVWSPQNPYSICEGELSADIELVVADNTTVGPSYKTGVMVDVSGMYEAIFDFFVADDEPHTLSITARIAEISEDSLDPFYLRIEAAGRLVDGIDIVLSADPVGLLMQMDPVSIGQGQSFVSVPVFLANNQLLGFDKEVTITATPSSVLDSASVTITVTDDESVEWGISSTLTNLNEGDGVVTGALLVSTGANLENDLLVSLSSDMPDRIVVPQSVTIPAGSSSVAIDVSVVDDEIAFANALATITATAAGLGEKQIAFGLADNDTIILALSAQNTTVSEGDAELADWVTISTGAILAEAVDVVLSLNDETEISVPEIVQIAVGTNSLSFALTVLDDALLDFTQTTTLKATWLGQNELLVFTVNDVESTQLDLVLSATEIAENAGVQTDFASVHTTAPVESSLAVTIVVSDTSQATLIPGPVNATATILAGTSSATVPFSTVDNTTREQDRSVDFTISATDCTGDAESLTILDDDEHWLETQGDAGWVDFGAFSGFMYDSDWTIVEKTKIPARATATGGYQFMRGKAFVDQTGDVTISITPHLVTDTWVWTVGAWVYGGASISMTTSQNGITILYDEWHTVALQYEKATTT